MKSRQANCAKLDIYPQIAIKFVCECVFAVATVDIGVCTDTCTGRHMHTDLDLGGNEAFRA